MGKILCFLVVLSVLGETHAQETPVAQPIGASEYDPLTPEEISAFTSGAISQVLYNFGDAINNDVEGSPFTMDFELGKISGYTNSYLMRYDAYNDEIQVKMSEEEVITIDKEKIEDVRFNMGIRFKVLTYTHEGRKRIGYLKVMQSNKHTCLLKKETITFEPAQEAKSSYEPATTARFNNVKDAYYIQTESDGRITPVSRKKDILNLFPSKKKELEKFIKSNKIKFSKEDDLKQLSTYLGTVLDEGKAE